MSFDPQNRELCPDGACIGVIGPDGQCRECGLPGTVVTRNPRYQGMRDDLEAVMGDGDDGDESGARDPEFERRELCPDGACIGVIGPDGRCRECGTPGRAGELNPRMRGLRDDDEIDDELEAHIAESDLAAAPDGFAERELCPDGACIGILGANGRCRECGASAGAPPSTAPD